MGTVACWSLHLKAAGLVATTHVIGDAGGTEDFQHLTLLHSAYATDQQLAVLRHRGLLHENYADPQFFLMCTKRFLSLALRHCCSKKEPAYQCCHQQLVSAASRGLINMLLCNVDAYKEHATAVSASYWQLVRKALSQCRIFFNARLDHPYCLLQGQCLVSLVGSADYSNLSLVGNALPVIHPASGATQQLRVKLGLPLSLELHCIAEHLTNTVEVLSCQSASHQIKIRQQLSEDVQAAYVQIVSQAAEYLEQGSATAPVFQSATELLRERPWVMTHSDPPAFKRPNELCYSLATNADDGEVYAAVYNVLRC